MGLFHRLSNIEPSEEELTDQGIASQTMTALLADGTFDAEATADLNLPDNIGGAAYENTDGSYTFVLWAKTETDQSEFAAANFSIPASMNITNFEKRTWDFSQTGIIYDVPSTGLTLTGAPVFLRSMSTTVNVSDERSLSQTIDLFPNPSQENFQLSVKGTASADLSVEVVNVIGELIAQRISEGSFGGRS